LILYYCPSDVLSLFLTFKIKDGVDGKLEATEGMEEANNGIDDSQTVDELDFSLPTKKKKKKKKVRKFIF
jgi:hypothetical protein